VINTYQNAIVLSNSTYSTFNYGITTNTFTSNNIYSNLIQPIYSSISGVVYNTLNINANSGNLNLGSSTDTLNIYGNSITNTSNAINLITNNNTGQIYFNSNGGNINIGGLSSNDIIYILMETQQQLRQHHKLQLKPLP